MWTRGRLVAVTACATAMFGVGAAAQTTAPVRKLQLSFDHGKVTLIAQNVTPREIMAEWARLCGCIVKDGDQTPGGPITVPVEFDAQPESVVLGSILSGAAGYALGPRYEGTQGASIYGVVAVFPVSHAAAAAYSSPTSYAAPLTTAPDDELPPVTPVPSVTTPPPAQNRPILPGQSNGVPPGRPAGPAVPIIPVGGTGRGGGPGGH